MTAKLFRFVHTFIVTSSLLLLGWTSYSVVHYLRTSSRFEVRQLSVSGIRRANENDVVARANFEIGANVFQVDLAAIRQRVEDLPWVHHALVQRVLPDQIVVKVIEREPIGLARIRGEIYQFDADATILKPDAEAFSGDISFPVLDGLALDDRDGNLQKVAVYRKVLAELGETELSEVHVTGASDVSVVSASDPLIVNIGDGDFRTRWIKYLELKTQIHRQYPEAVRIDLRFRNQVIVRMRNDEAGERVIWDAAKKLL